MNNNHSYRRDIDGLRAIAVLAVIIFHINKDVLPGGFVGVDVFFVLSGFLITGKLFDDLAAGSFSLRDFYVRRIKRIVPAMLVVVLATLAAAQALLLPEDAKNAGKAGIAAVASVANVYYTYFSDAGYFAASSTQLPFLHLWSLGVEEQFYLIWPLVLALLNGRVRGAVLLLLMAGAALASFIAAELLFTRNPSFVYYMLPTRAGELLGGAIAAWVLREGLQARLSAASWRKLGWLGAALLAASVWLLHEDQVFPGVRAMLPVAATVLLLLAGSQDAALARMLGWAPLRAIGLVSYSAYLWHWPLLAFYRYGYGEPGLASGVAIFVLTLALAWLTYAWVEQPFRRVSGARWKAIFAGYGVASVAAAAAAVLVMKPALVLERLYDSGYGERLAQVRAGENAPDRFKYVCMRAALTRQDAADPRCVINGGAAVAGKPSVLLWGDSNAAHYVGMVGAFARHAGFSFRNLEVGTCAPLLGPVDGIVHPQRVRDCGASQAVVREVLKTTDIVIMAAAYSSYQDRSPRFLERLFGTVRELTASGKRVVLIGRIPIFEQYDRACAAKALTYPWLRCEPLRAPMDGAVARLNDRLRAFAAAEPNVAYFDATAQLCPNGQCSTHDAAGNKLYYDGGHLTVPAGWEIGEAIVKRGGVPSALTVDVEVARVRLTPDSKL